MRPKRQTADALEQMVGALDDTPGRYQQVMAMLRRGVEQPEGRSLSSTTVATLQRVMCGIIERALALDDAACLKQVSALWEMPVEVYRGEDCLGLVVLDHAPQRAALRERLEAAIITRGVAVPALRLAVLIARFPLGAELLDEVLQAAEPQAEGAGVLGLFIQHPDHPCMDLALLRRAWANCALTEREEAAVALARALRRDARWEGFKEDYASLFGQLQRRQDVLGRLFVQAIEPPCLEVELLRLIWGAMSLSLRVELLGELAQRPAAASPLAPGLVDMFIDLADTPQEQVQVLRLRERLPTPRHVEVARGLLTQANPQMRAIGLTVLAEQPTREALPALSALLPGADSAERRRIVAALEAIHAHDPMPGDVVGALSASELGEELGALTLAEDAEPQEVVRPARRLQGALAPELLFLNQRQRDQRAEHAALEASWRLLEPAPRALSLAVRCCLFVLGTAGERSFAWLALALPGPCFLWAALRFDDVRSNWMYLTWLICASMWLVYLLVREFILRDTPRHALRESPGLSARVEGMTLLQASRGQDVFKVRLRLDDGRVDELVTERWANIGACLPALRQVRFGVPKLLLFSHWRSITLTPHGVLVAERKQVFMALVLFLSGVAGFVLGAGALFVQRIH